MPESDSEDLFQIGPDSLIHDKLTPNYPPNMHPPAYLMPSRPRTIYTFPPSLANTPVYMTRNISKNLASLLPIIDTIAKPKNNLEIYNHVTISDSKTTHYEDHVIAKQYHILPYPCHVILYPSLETQSQVHNIQPCRPHSR